MAKIAEITKENRKEVFKNLYDTWAATIIGLVPSDVEVLEFFVKEHGGLTTDAEIVRFTGKDMNEFFALVKDPYPEDLNCYAISGKHIVNVNALALPMRELGMRWFTDIVDNNAVHEDNVSFVEELLGSESHYGK